ncbi:MAG: flagellar motor protein MotB [Alphaproteobacteria bacterium]
MATSNTTEISEGPAIAAPRRGSRGGPSGVMSMLSIFLLLLAFFVMLNTLAQFETTKTRAVIGSLNATFNIGNPSGPEHEFGSFVGRVGAASQVQAELNQLLRTLFGVGRYELIRLGNVVVLDIDADALFTRAARPSPALLVFANHITGRVLPPPPGTRLNLEVTTYRGVGSLDGADLKTINVATRRAGAIVRGFERVGFEADQLVAGLAEGSPRKIRIEFRVTDLLSRTRGVSP